MAEEPGPEGHGPEPGPRLCVDHLVWVVPSLPEGIAAFERLTGVTPGPGGRHEGLGTHNALVSLGEGVYVELLATDPAQDSCPPWLGLDAPAPRLTTFCARAARGESLEEVRAAAQARDGYDAGPPVDMSRQAVDGGQIRWRLAAANHRCGHAQLPMGGIVPFLIDWSPNERPHPSESAPSGCSLLGLRAWHPDPAAAGAVLAALGADCCLEREGAHAVAAGSEARLEASLSTPRGVVVLA